MSAPSFTPTKAPTVKQATARMLPGHRHVLDCVARRLPYVSPRASTSEIRGYRTCLHTLLVWGALDQTRTEDPVTHYTSWILSITPFGRELLAACDARFARAARGGK